MEHPFLYREFSVVGRDYTASEEAAIYDACHARFRDVAAEADAVVELLGLKPGGTLLDFGCGTGGFVVRAAEHGLRVTGIDVSQAMLDVARARLHERSLGNARLVQAGFLTYAHSGPPVDAVVSTFALHHLPDFWKGVALDRLHALLRPGGQLYLRDVVLPNVSPLESITRFIATQQNRGGNELRDDALGHFRDEYSTYAWVMEGLFERAGFQIKERRVHDEVIFTYHCVRD